MKALKLALPVLALAATSCAKSGDIDVNGGVGVSAVRSACPATGIPAGTGDITLFDPPASRTATAIDVTAAITKLRATCNDAGTDVVSTVTFEVDASRMHAGTPRDVTFPFFVTVVRGGTAVVAKRIGQVSVHFNADQTRASATGQGGAVITRAAATLPDDIRQRITKRRKPGEEDAAIDPLAQPDVRQAVLRVSFEALVGFQLTDEQLKYNVTR